MIIIPYLVVVVPRLLSLWYKVWFGGIVIHNVVVPHLLSLWYKSHEGEPTNQVLFMPLYV